MTGRNILIVDDSATDRALMSEALQPEGYILEMAEDGESALELARSRRPAVMLLDIVLPGSNGFEVCRELKGDPATADIRIILVSSKDQEFDRYWGLRQGADDYLVKPFSDQALRDSVAQQLSAGGAG